MNERDKNECIALADDGYLHISSSVQELVQFKVGVHSGESAPENDDFFRRHGYQYIPKRSKKRKHFMRCFSFSPGLV